MNKIETPTTIIINRVIGGSTLRFKNVVEISQGGPEVGELSVNDRELEGKFGGPIIFNDEFIYLPALYKRFFGVAFKLARINLKSLEIEYHNKIFDLIYLDKISNNKILYFTDIEKTKKNYLDLTAKNNLV